VSVTELTKRRSTAISTLPAAVPFSFLTLQFRLARLMIIIVQNARNFSKMDRHALQADNLIQKTNQVVAQTHERGLRLKDSRSDWKRNCSFSRKDAKAPRLFVF